ncbi:30S ribosomal protein S17 [Candidatus Woesearchaeota archaeon]|jgi:small subunit ribosomal protein S17|nr:30S ribosomal protein S17 [Candidatus Woesearchaeota archaeon]MBT4114757.1 30S ribosomal protein S17 [Candidatus Woesearchaeota archaeon]MBT4248130.1 30S ribosomal protein S17 [Candidatus Woesearchaeota archaeon]
MVEKKKTTAKKVAKPVTAKKVTPKKVVKAAEVKTVEKKLAVSCSDINCHVHGSNKVRGRIFEGKVIRAKMAKTITVEWPRQYFLSKYERFQKRRSRVKAHNPQCISAKEGDMVRIAECRPLSKSKNFVVLEVLK